MSSGNGIGADRLRSFVERIERLEEEKKALVADIREVYSEAKGEGFDTKAMRQVIKERKQDAAERQEFEAVCDLYRQALGMAGPLGEAAAERAITPLERAREIIGEAGGGKIAMTEFSVEGGSFEIGKAAKARGAAGSLLEAVHAELLARGFRHEGGNRYTAPEA